VDPFLKFSDALSVWFFFMFFAGSTHKSGHRQMAEDFAAAVASLRTRRGAAGGSDRLA